jgi:hypothetical protein
MIAAASILVKGKVQIILANPTAERVIEALSRYQGSSHPVEARVFPRDNGAPALVGRFVTQSNKISWKILRDNPALEQAFDDALSASRGRVLFPADAGDL